MKLSQVREIASALKDDLTPYAERIEIGGSIRRKKSEPNDIELICIPKFADVKTGQSTLSGGETTVRRNCLFRYLDNGYFVLKGKDKSRKIQIGEEPDDIKVDIFTATPTTWGYIFMLRTGPWEFSKFVVTKLKMGGCLLQDGGIYEDGRLLETPDERSVFRLLGMDYVSPLVRGL